MEKRYDRKITLNNRRYERCLQLIENDIDIIILKLSELSEKKKTIAAVIDRVPDNVQQSVLTRRYILFQRFHHIASEMQYSERQIYNIHSAALDSVQNILNAP